jgi:hypothetical protein
LTDCACLDILSGHGASDINSGTLVKAIHSNSGVPTTSPLDIMADVKRNTGKASAGQVPEAIDSLAAAIGARYVETERTPVLC